MVQKDKHIGWYPTPQEAPPATPSGTPQKLQPAIQPEVKPEEGDECNIPGKFYNPETKIFEWNSNEYADYWDQAVRESKENLLKALGKGYLG
ncbi:hypothetical protein N7492_005577 [Penicillium capsulatum]|uniref:Uncharacterized protein n=1 Tax=Penicillium capsulatum TaxID=69766 RepID=A0A9W9IBT3_9EURO|nr:hypothetical protein N7492_005577 [Penicillium capsulatum]